MPYALPPVTGNLGATRTTENGTRTGLHVDVGFSPMQLAPSQFARRWDATIAGSYDRMGSRDAWGAAAFGGPILYPWGLRRDTSVRLMPQAVARWTQEAPSVGGRVAIERAAFARGSGGGSSAYGEGSFGVYVEGDRRFDDEWTFVAGVTMRVPAIAGIACCFH